MLTLKRTLATDEDLIGIYRYSLKHFGKHQAETYFEGITTALEIICSNPLISPVIDEIRGSFRIYRYRQHIIIYQIESHHVLIVRVLHKRMDIKEKLVRKENEEDAK
jgi:toxin ParE1/3/4